MGEEFRCCVIESGGRGREGERRLGGMGRTVVQETMFRNVKNLAAPKKNTVYHSFPSFTH